MSSTFCSEGSLPYWTWAGHLLDLLVAVGVVGESYCHLIPDRWLPAKLRSNATRKIAGKWSTALLAVAIVVVVPIGVIKDRIDDRIVSGLGTQVHDLTAAREITETQSKAIVARMARFKGQAFQIIAFWQVKESIGFANRVAAVLLAAGWTLDQPKAATMIVGALTGVHVSVNPGAPATTREAANELVIALRENGTVADAVDDTNGGPDAKIYMQIGTKP